MSFKMLTFMGLSIFDPNLGWNKYSVHSIKRAFHN